MRPLARTSAGSRTSDRWTGIRQRKIPTGTIERCPDGGGTDQDSGRRRIGDERFDLGRIRQTEGRGDGAAGETGHLRRRTAGRMEAGCRYIGIGGRRTAGGIGTVRVGSVDRGKGAGWCDRER